MSHAWLPYSAIFKNLLHRNCMRDATFIAKQGVSAFCKEVHAPNLCLVLQDTCFLELMRHQEPQSERIGPVLSC
jgi:hypothetical protein